MESRGLGDVYKRQIDAHDRTGSQVDKAFLVLGLEYLKLMAANESKEEQQEQDEARPVDVGLFEDVTVKVVEAIIRFNETQEGQRKYLDPDECGF